MRSGDRTVWIAFAAGLVVALITGGAEVLAQGYDEDFETGDFSHWPWETGGTGDEWFVTTDSVHGGLYAARAGAVTPYQYSFLEVEFDCEAGEISFFKRVSCYPCCEARLRFTIDGVEQGSWAGEVDWNATAHSYTVTAGPHAFRWEYRRGETPAGGADTAWIDDINFPPGIVALPPDAPVLDAEPEYTQGTSNTLSWQEANRADEYYLEWDTEDSFASPDGNSGWITSTSHEATGLADGQTHYYRVKGKNWGVEGPWSNTVSSTQDASAPTSSVNALPSLQTTAPFVVSWTSSDAGSGVQYTRLYYAYDSDLWYQQYGWDFTGTSSSFTPIYGDGPYFFYTRATDNVDNVEDAPGTPDVSIMVDAKRPSSFAYNAGRPYYTTPIINVWYLASDPDKGTGVQYVRLWYRRRPLAGGDWGEWTQYGGHHVASPISFDTTTTGADGEYGFYTRATDGAGHTEGQSSGDCAIKVITGGDGGLTAPTMTEEPEYTLGTSNEVFWTGIHGDATDSEVQCATDEAFGAVAQESGLLDTPTSSHTFTGLTEGTKYYYHARAACELDDDSSGAWTQTTQAEFQTDTLTNTQATSDDEVILADALGTPFADTIGNKGGGAYNWARYSTFNLYTCTTSRTLTEIESYLTISNGPLELMFLVYESTDESGPYTQIHSNTDSAPGMGKRFYSSGPISVPLEGGKYYLIGAGTSGVYGISYWMAFMAHPQTAAFGHTISGKYYFASSPPPGTISGSLVNTSYCFYQRLSSAADEGYVASGSVVSTPIAPSSLDYWSALSYTADTSAEGTAVTVDVLDGDTGALLEADVPSGERLFRIGITAPSIKLRANLSTTDTYNTPKLSHWSVTYAQPTGFVVVSPWSNVVHSTQRSADCELAYTGDTNKAFGEEVNLSAHLTASGTPVEGQTVCFTVDRFTGHATTDSNGDAAVTVGAYVLKPGTYTVHCRSDAGNGYNAATAEGTLQITGGGTDTVVSGNGWYFKEGRKRCMAKFRYSDGAQAGFLTIKDLATRTNIVAVSVTNVTVHAGGDDATITGNCNINGSPTPVAFTLDVTASSNSFHFVAGGYEAGPTTLKGKIEITEE